MKYEADKDYRPSAYRPAIDPLSKRVYYENSEPKGNFTMVKRSFWTITNEDQLDNIESQLYSRLDSETMKTPDAIASHKRRTQAMLARKEVLLQQKAARVHIPITHRTFANAWYGNPALTEDGILEYALEYVEQRKEEEARYMKAHSFKTKI